MENDPDGGLVRESTQDPLNSGLGIILICPEMVNKWGYTLLINGVYWGCKEMIRSPLILTSCPGHPSRDPGSPKLRIVMEPKYDLHFEGDEGHSKIII